MSDFWSMGGYAVYVWGSYAATLVVFAWNLIAPAMRRSELSKHLDDAPDAEQP